MHTTYFMEHKYSVRTKSVMRCEYCEFLSKPKKIIVHFNTSYLSSTKLVGYVGLSDFNETWPKCSLDTNVPSVRLSR